MISSINEEACIGCGACVKTCALDVFRLDTHSDKAAPCMAACPARNDFREINALLQQSRLDEALDCLKRTMPFPALAGAVCSHPCEKPCSRHRLDSSVNIRGIEAFLGERDVARSLQPVPRRHVFKVAVLGAGAAGLSAAWYLTEAGYPVTVFEAEAQAGGRMRYGTPEERADLAVLDAYASQLQCMGAQFRYSSPLQPWREHWLEELEDLGFRAVVLAVGDVRGKKPPHGLACTASGSVRVHPLTCQTSVRTVFAAGHAASDTSSPVQAMAAGRKAALAIGNILQGANPDMGLNVRLHTVEPKDLSSLEKLERREGDAKGSLPLEDALEEAVRCLTCGSKARIAYPDDCMTCFACEVRCPADAIDVDPFKEFHPRHLDRRFIGGAR